VAATAAPSKLAPIPGIPKSAVVIDPLKSIRVRGAREHNLKGIDLDIPRDKLVVITGLSGSGKSSLAFDTIFAEGQRKYMESLSAYARQFLDQLKKPDVEDIQGLPPTIAIEQRSSGHNPRSTVATSTEIYDYLRLLFARCGCPTCWEPTKLRKDGTITERCGQPITASSASQIVDSVLALAQPSTRLMVLAPVIRQKKGFHRDVLEMLQSAGWSRIRVNGQIKDLREILKDPGDNPLSLARYEKHDLDAVIDRLTIDPADTGLRQRLAEAVEGALKLAEGAVTISSEVEGKGATPSTWYDRIYSDKHACALHPTCALAELEPRIFSFNSPFGACPACDGLGSLMELDEALVLPNNDLSFKQGAIAAFNKNHTVRAWFSRGIKKFCRFTGFDYEAPISALSAEQRKMLLQGTTAEDAKKHGFKFVGVMPELQGWFNSTENDQVKEWLGQFMSQTPCKSCHGDRLKIDSLAVMLRTKKKLPQSIIEGRARHGLTTDHHTFTISDFSKLNIAEAIETIDSLQLTAEQLQIAEPIVKEVKSRLGFLASVGLQYLSLDRKTATLSGGEAQRIRLATQVGSGLVGACYVLDEPTIGLHQRDNDRLIRTLRHLCDIGNTVLVVEHDEDMIRAADQIIDIGPGPGVHGGRVVAQGTADELAANPASLTGKYLSGELSVPLPAKRRALSDKRAITIKGAKHNNLKNVDVTIPLGGLVCVTGVSGSGKSTLVNEILLLAIKRELTASRVKPGLHKSVTGIKHLTRIVEVDQSPIGRTPRSNPATYTGFFDDVRKVFTTTKEAKIRGYEPGRFSFNVKGGRCEACQGQGTKKIEMHFLPDVFVECEVCKGRRFNRETLEIVYRGKSIADVLDMTIEEGCTFFENHPKILRYLTCLRDVGLDYIKLGQPSTQLSGGEAQRVKLATELAGGDVNTLASSESAKAIEEETGRKLRGSGFTSHALYILDEPTTGLHFEDIRKLVGVMQRLADAGSSLVVIEHNLDVIKCADHIIDLGPEGGLGGGTIVATGTPEQIAANPNSHTGHYLKPFLKR
jgi:excinuclease ABC subunit A